MKQIDIFCTSDIHGFLEGVDGRKGVYQTLSEIKKEYPDRIFIDNGDYFSGSRMASYFNSQKESKPLLYLANQMGFDVMVPGNHDFDLGVSRLKELSLKATASYVCANLLDQKGEYVFKPWCIIDRGGFRVGIIGLVTGNLSQLTDVANLEGNHIVRPLLTLKNLIPKIRCQVDLLIVSYHGGMERDMRSGKWTQYDTGEDEAYKMIEEFPEIDSMICGHQHRIEAGCKNKTLYIQPGFGGRSIGRLSFTSVEEEPLLKEVELIHAPQREAQDSVPGILTRQWGNEYQVWCGEQMDLCYFEHFIRKHFPCDGYLLEIERGTRNEFYNSFTAPHHVSMYQFSKEEWEEIYSTYQDLDESGKIFIERREIPDKRWYRILSNIQTLPYDRLIHRYLQNIPDIYEMELAADRAST